MLSIDLVTAEVFFQASPQAQSLDVATYFAEMIRHYDARRFVRLDIFLDRNTTHKAKMQNLLADLLAKDTIKTTIDVRFHLMPAYSPKLNPVEYAIHEIRQQVLHNADCKHSLSVFVERIKELCSTGIIFSQEQIINILGYIESLVPNFNR